MDGYDDSQTDFVPTKSYYCGKCNREMEELTRKDSVCPTCGKVGWDVIFKCPKCELRAESFKQDESNLPVCHCNP